MHFADIAQRAAADGTISADEILRLRQAGWADGKMTRGEAEAIFAAQRAVTHPSNEWSDFFVEAIKQHVVEGSEPRGYASEEEARWLIEQVKADGRVCSMTELEVLTRIIEKAQQVPQVLKSFVLDVLEQAVLTGTGPTRSGGELSDKHVTEAECMLIRRTIFGSGGDRPAGVSRSEAEMLFRLKAATDLSANAPEFKRLFVQGVANYLMAFTPDSAQMDRDRMLELEAFMNDTDHGTSQFVGKMFGASPSSFGKIFGKRKPVAPMRADRVEEAHDVTTDEQDWLDAQIHADGEVDDYERALIAFIAEENGEA